jgi:hypothetical protein
MLAVQAVLLESLALRDLKMAHKEQDNLSYNKPTYSITRQPIVYQANL